MTGTQQHVTLSHSAQSLISQVSVHYRDLDRKRIIAVAMLTVDFNTTIAMGKVSKDGIDNDR